MKLGYKLLSQQLLIGAFILLLFHQVLSEPFLYGRLLGLFVGGAGMAHLMEGPR